jgi:hypothetical protein
VAPAKPHLVNQEAGREVGMPLMPMGLRQLVVAATESIPKETATGDSTMTNTTWRLLHILGPEALATGCSLLGSREDSLREPVGFCLQDLWPYICSVRSTYR